MITLKDRHEYLTFTAGRYPFPLVLNRGMNKMKSITWLGVCIALLAILGLAIPEFSTSQTRNVASLGDVKIQSTQQFTHVVPVALSVGGLILGCVLIGAGVYSKREI